MVGRKCFNMAEFFEGTLWLVEEVEGYWIPNITNKTVAKLPKCPHCGTRFGTIALNYKYCPECGKNVVGRK
jgi:tRNA(Ile2) C34 agmatinyltransferase TiaS